METCTGDCDGNGAVTIDELLIGVNIALGISSIERCSVFDRNGDLMVTTNGWDPAVLQRFREDSVVTSVAGGIDHKATPEQIEHIATLIPDEWLEPSATGSAQQCVDRIRKEFDYGADAVIMHGATPDELEPIVDEYRASQ